MKRHPLNINDYQAFVKVYNGETDRAAVVLAGSFAEHYLATFIRHFLIADKEVERLFENGALASFDARINIAYAFNLISKEQRNDLRIIKDIRNRFAHSPFPIGLDDPATSAQIKNLSILSVIEDTPNTTDIQKSPRYLYLFTIGLFVILADQKTGEKWMKSGE